MNREILYAAVAVVALVLGLSLLRKSRAPPSPPAPPATKTTPLSPLAPPATTTAITQGLYAINTDIVQAVNGAMAARQKAKGQPSTSLVATQADYAVQNAREKIAAGRSVLNAATKVSAWLSKPEADSMLQTIQSQEAALK